MNKSSTDSMLPDNFIKAADPCSLADLLADAIAQQIDVSIRQRGRAIVAFSGGSTPKPLFQSLCRREIDWARVVITLVDERWVPPSHKLSNGAFLHSHLLSALPKTQFVSLYADAPSVEASLPLVLSEFQKATASSKDHLASFDVVVLGMGDDGHTASFFPDADNIEDLVDPSQDKPLLCCESPSTQVARVTWSLPMLLNTKLLALHFTGRTKLGVFERAREPGAVTELPIRSVLQQTKTPVQVFYAE